VGSGTWVVPEATRKGEWPQWESKKVLEYILGRSVFCFCGVFWKY
jgi:hypothetical protein